MEKLEPDELDKCMDALEIFVRAVDDWEIPVVNIQIVDSSRGVHERPVHYRRIK
jgi:hypothetical protein